MVEFDPVLGAILVGVAGILLWIVTNWHLVRTGRAIKAEIDEKREATEAFVQGELASLREDLGGAVELDADPLMTAFEERIVPAIEARVESVKSVLLGKMGYAKKAVKAVGEGVVELVGNRAVEEAGFEAEWQMRLAQLGMDDEYLKTHKTVAFGLSLIKEAYSKGQSPIEDGIRIGAPAKAGGPPKGFG